MNEEEYEGDSDCESVDEELEEVGTTSGIDAKDVDFAVLEAL